MILSSHLQISMNQIDPLMIAGEQDHHHHHPTTIIIHPSYLGSCPRTPMSPMSRREIRRPRPRRRLRRFRHGRCRWQRQGRRGGIQELLWVEALQGSLPTPPTAIGDSVVVRDGGSDGSGICVFLYVYIDYLYRFV